MEFIFFLTIALLVIAAYYALVFMPRQYAFKKHQKYVTSLEVGDEVITSGGLIGTITELDVEVGIAKIRLAEGLEVRIVAAAILQAYDPAEIERNAKLGLGIPDKETQD
jgi:preprotein translocase subunit YajC